ncbi:MAG: thiamine pyrophosphate-dependent enzyme [Candidatus Binatia bacterium]
MPTFDARNGAELILGVLRRHGVEYIFCSPIAVWAPLWEALARQRESARVESPRYLNCRHELLAVGLASGFYKATGRPQVVLLPTGLGVLNGSMGLRTAMQERTPMTVIAPDTATYGEVPELDPGPEWPQLLIDLAGPARDGEGCVKWAKEVKTAGGLEADLRRALYFADLVPRGPTLLSVPFDALMEPTRLSDQPRLVPNALVSGGNSLQRVAEVLARSANPIFITEHAGRTADGAAALLGLAEHLGAPVFEVWGPAYHNVPRSHAMYGGIEVDDALGAADCIVVAGCNAPWHPPHPGLRDDCQVLVFEEDPLRPRAAYWGYRTDLAIAGDLGPNLAALLSLVRERIPSPALERGRRWAERNRARREAWQAELASPADGRAIPAATLFRALHNALPERTAIVDEIVAQLTFMLHWLFESKPFRHYRGWAGALGTGLPTALGVKLANPSDVVVCVIGDGAFYYNPVPACFGLAQQYGLPVLVVICNNQGFASQEWNLAKYFPGGAAMRTQQQFGKVIAPTPEYALLPQAFGGHGERVLNAAELGPAIARALAAVRRGQLAVLDVLVEP